MINRISIILLFLANISAYSQELSDTIYRRTEMEDSISAMSIVKIKRPKALLDSIIMQVISDSKQKPVRCKYLVEETTGLHLPAQNISRCVFHARANIRIKATGEAEEFYNDGTPRLRNLIDTARVYYALRDCCLEGDYILRLVLKNSDGSVFQEFQHLMSLHHITVYSISDEKGRGVYRVDFSPRKHIGYGYNASKYSGTAYFDKKTLHVMQIKTDKISPTSFDINDRQDKKGLLSHTFCQHYQMDFEVVGGTPVVKQIESAAYVDNQLTGKFAVQRISN